MKNSSCVCMCEMEMFIRENEPLVDELAELQAKIKSLQNKQKTLKDALIERMSNHHISSFETDSAKISYVEDSNYKTVDSEKLKTQYPSAYWACSKYYYKDSYLIMRLKK